VLVQHAKVAMRGPRHVQDVGARAGGVERAGDLLSDVRRLAGAGDADAAWATADQLDGLQERPIEPLGDLEQGGRLFAHDLAGIGERVEKLGGRVDLQRHGKHPCEPPASGASITARRGFSRRLYRPTREKQRQAAREARGRLAFVVHAAGILEEIQKQRPRRQSRKDVCPVVVMGWAREAAYFEKYETPRSHAPSFPRSSLATRDSADCAPSFSSEQA
jgi:hypothetical protein